ncbi:MAG: type II toxin-antitoxin system RelE/ParE family toxin [Methanosarcinales archaeon]|nr:type II toxin-antitoxin system RelE/ParE family toxin [Methanosarcinales archaeon]
MYEIRIKKSAEKDLDALDDMIYIRIDRNIQILRNDPFPKGVAKLRGGGNRYRVREGKYRMLYEIDQKNKIIIIYRIKLRKTAYD